MPREGLDAFTQNSSFGEAMLMQACSDYVFDSRTGKDRCSVTTETTVVLGREMESREKNWEGVVMLF